MDRTVDRRWKWGLLGAAGLAAIAFLMGQGAQNTTQYVDLEVVYAPDPGGLGGGGVLKYYRMDSAGNVQQQRNGGSWR